MKIELEKAVTLELINIILSDVTNQEKVVKYNHFVRMIEALFEEAKEILEKEVRK